MIIDSKKWHYLAVKSLFELFRGIATNHKDDFYCLNCLHSYTTKNYLNYINLKSIIRYVKIMRHAKIIENMPNEKSKILKYNHGQKFMKFPFVIYANSKSLLKKFGNCYNNPEILSTTKINARALFHYSLFAQCSFDPTKNMLDYYRGKFFMIRFSKDLKEHINYKIIKNYEQK